MSTDEEIPGDDPTLLEIAGYVSDGAPVDWESTRTRDPSLEATFEKLRSIEAVARQHRIASDGDRTAAIPKTGARASETELFSWGHLRVLEKLGEGGFGEVWRAWDPALQREVALKLRGKEVRGRGAARWLEEARRLARVRHPHVLSVHGADLHDGRSGIWTDLIRGRTLASWLEVLGPLGAREATVIGIDLCTALSAVHAAGIVHGDVKASNVMREGEVGGDSGAGRIVLMDFGSAHDTTGSGSLSAGTPMYTAPEVLAGGPLTPSADLYSLGVLLFRLVSGRYPVESQAVADLQAGGEKAKRISLRALRPDLPPAFLQIVERAIEPDPAHRFRDAAELERALSSVLGAGSWTRAPRRVDPRMFAAAFALGAACCVVAWWLAQQWPRWSKSQFVVAPTGAAIATSLSATLLGEEPRGCLGSVVIAAGDVDGDSLGDLLVSSLSEDAGRGGVDLYLGRLGTTPERVMHLRGESPGDAFGSSLAANGDLNGDGYADFAVGARERDTEHLDSGGVYVWFGGASLDSIPDLVLEGGSVRQFFGSSVACSKDVNGDGYDDLLVGAPLDFAGGNVAGRALVYWGGPNMDAVADLDLTSAASSSQFGVYVELGDLNGDDFADIIVGANWENTDAQLAGRVYIYNGGRVPDTNPDLVLRGPFQGAMFGYPLCALDLNGDAYDDLAVGQGGIERGKTGEVRIFFGGARPDALADLRLMGPEAGDAFGLALAPAGDVNGDGLVDLLVTAPLQDEALRDAGAAYVYFGGRRPDNVADVKLLGDELGASFGWGAATLGDNAHDGLADLAIGAPHATGLSRDSGKLYLFDARRYVLTRPRPGDVWPAGREVTIAWLGAERADLALSTDGGRSYAPVSREVGGQGENVLALTAPAIECDSVYVRVTATRRDVRGEAQCGPIRIAR